MNRSRRRWQGAGEHIESGRLAGPVGPDHTNDLTDVNLEIEIAHGMQPTEAPRHAESFQKNRSGQEDLLAERARSQTPTKPRGSSNMIRTTTMPKIRAW